MHEKLIEKIVELREWLNKNKIFFETVGTIALSIMAIIVSIGALLISFHQSDLVEIENQPEFLFDIGSNPYGLTITGYNTTENFSQDQLIIKNIGKPFKKLKMDYTTIFAFDYESKDDQNITEIKFIKIPIDRVIDEYPTVDTEGNIRIAQILLKDGNNSTIYEKTMNLFQDYIRQKGDKFHIVFPIRLLKITYDDIYGKSHTKYYFISDDGGSTQVSIEEYESVLEKFEFSELPTHFVYLYLLPQIMSKSNQTDIYNSTFFDPWYQAIKKNFKESPNKLLYSIQQETYGYKG